MSQKREPGPDLWSNSKAPSFPRPRVVSVTSARTALHEASSGDVSIALRIDPSEDALKPGAAAQDEWEERGRMGPLMHMDRSGRQHHSAREMTASRVGTHTRPFS
jgi:hypothetical protein